jgi:predicted  nucleic acid-binding Zn-ribbon protein
MEATMTDKKEIKESFLSTSERLLEATKKGIHTATFKANQYKKIVQKKIDLNAVQKKIATAHADLGKLIDDLREAGGKAIMTKPEVKEMFSQIDTLKQTAADLLSEIEGLKNEEEPTVEVPTAHSDSEPEENETKE